MTTQDIAETTETAEETSGGGMRKQLEASLARTKELEAKERVRAFTDAGFDVETGMGKAISQVYDGEVSKEAILKFSSDEYGHTPSTAETVPPPHPQAAQIAVGQAQLDAVAGVAGSVAQTTRSERLAVARQTGDSNTEAAINAANMQDMMDRQNQHL